MLPKKCHCGGLLHDFSYDFVQALQTVKMGSLQHSDSVPTYDVQSVSVNLNRL